MTRQAIAQTAGKILTFESAIEKIAESRDRGEKIILAQGAFDIVHVGHLLYLRLSKTFADKLFVGLDTDEDIKINKGQHRPYNPLYDRLDLLSELHHVDYAFPLLAAGEYRNIDTYTERLALLKPDMLAVSHFDPLLENKRISADKAGVEMVVINDIWVNSTTNLAQKMGLER